MLSIRVLSNKNNEFLKEFPAIHNVNIDPFSIEEIKELELGNLQENLTGVIIIDSFDYFNVISFLIKKRIPIFISDFHKLSLNKAKRLLDLHEEASSYIQVNSPNRFEFKDINYWHRIEDPQLISITKHFNESQTNDFKEFLYNEIENSIARIKSKPRKISPIQIPKKTEEIQTVDVRIEFENGAVLKITISSVIPNPTHTIEFIKWNNYEKIDLINCEYTINKSKETFTKVVSPKHSEIIHFCSNLFNNTPPEVNIEDGLITIELIDKIIC